MGAARGKAKNVENDVNRRRPDDAGVRFRSARGRLTGDASRREADSRLEGRVTGASGGLDPRAEIGVIDLRRAAGGRGDHDQGREPRLRPRCPSHVPPAYHSGKMNRLCQCATS